MPLSLIFLDLEFDIYFFIFRYTVFHGASKMLQKLQSSGEMKGLLLFLFDQAAQLLGLRLRATVRVTQFHVTILHARTNILERKMI